MNKTLFSLLMLFVVSTAVAHDIEVDGIFYNILSQDDKTVAVTYYGTDNESAQYSGHVTIPQIVTYNGTTYSVTSIGTYAFFYCAKLTGATIPSSVTSIELSAFWVCI